MYKGKNDRRIRIERATETRDDFNNVIQTWNLLMNVWTRKEDIRDSERIASQEIGSEVTTRFDIEWYDRIDDLNPKDRIVYNGMVYNIINVREIGRKQGMSISATARTDK